MKLEFSQHIFKISITKCNFMLPILCVSIKVKVKLKFTLEQATKAQRGSRGIALLFLLPRR